MKAQLTLLSPAKPSLGLYLRPGWNDHTVFLRLLAEDKAVSGLVLDARHQERHRLLREALVGNGVHAVLDTDFMQMSNGTARWSSWSVAARARSRSLRLVSVCARPGLSHIR